MADDKRVIKRNVKPKLPGKKPIPGAKNEVKSDVVMDKVSDAEDAVESSTFPKRDLTDAELENLADMVLSFSQKMCGITLYPYEAELGFRIIYSLLSEDSEEISALYSRQAGKCLKLNTKVMMYDGSIKFVQDIKVGDELMGDDSTPRRVLSLARGRERMWKVVPRTYHHDSYTVNESHILSVYNRSKDRHEDLDVVTVLDGYDGKYMGYAAPVDFPHREVLIEPYWLGLWLGDGNSYDVRVTTPDKEVVDYVYNYAERLGMTVSVYLEHNKSDTYAINHGNNGHKKVNQLRVWMREANLFANKHLPEIYKFNSREVRSQVLAGIIDSDGHVAKASGKNNSCEVTLKIKELAEDVQWLARSLGFRASIRPKSVKGTVYWRVCFYGSLWELPIRIERKKRAPGKLKDNPLRYGFYLKYDGVDDYYGFEIDGNKRFLLGDFTVTHNTETISVIVCGCMVMLPVLGMALPHESRISKFSNGLWCGIYAPVYEQAGIMWRRMKLRLYSKSAKEVLLDPDINIDLSRITENMTLPNGSFVDCGTASPQSHIEGKTYHIVIIDECLGPDSMVDTPSGQVSIQNIVERKYKGKVRAWDHDKEVEVWADVLGHLKRPAHDTCYEFVFSDGTVHQCTHNHLWYVDGVGYVSAQKLFDFTHKFYYDEFHSVSEGFKQSLLFFGVQGGKKKAVRLRSIKVTNEIQEVYDITTSTGNFFASGILSHNCQDVSAFKLRASIHPMLASTGGTLVKIGTPSVKKSEFYETCRRNKRKDVSSGRLRHRVRSHFEYDYTVVQQYNDRYRKYVTKEIERLGEDSDEFRMKYRLHWILERGMFVNADLFDECGISKPNQNLFIDIKKRAPKRKGGRPRRINFSRPINTVNYDVDTPAQVAAIDVGKSNSTVITVGKVFWDGPVQFGDEQRFPIHVQNWLELFGDDHEAQHNQIVNFLKNYRLQSVIVDATGKGDPVYDRLAAELDKYGIFVMPFLFSTQSKDVGYKILLQELQNRRITYPAGPAATKMAKWQRFYNQMVDLEKKWHGQRMIVSKAVDDNAARDDFCDSFMMLCYLVNAASDQEVEVGPNPLIGRAARWEISETMKQAGAWFRRAVNPRGTIPTTRPNKHGKWDAQ